MIERLQKLVLRVLKVPPRPDPPAGTAASVRVFRAARQFYYLRLLRWAVAQAGALVGMLVVLGIIPITVTLGAFDPAVARHAPDGVQGIGSLVAAGFAVLEVVGVAVFVVQLPFTFAVVRLDWTQRWYIVTDRSLRIREGVRTVREMTMTFANVQELTIRQNPLQRVLGISDLRVRTAGGGSTAEAGDHGDDRGGKSMHLAYFRGVANAEEIRDVILERIRRLRGTGLGDPDEHTDESTVEASQPSRAVAEATAELQAEVQMLRARLRELPAP